MFSSVFINAVGKFLPGEPVTNEEVEEYIGLVGGNMGAGFRLVLHGLAAESLHAILREYKRLGRIVEPDQPVHAEWPRAQTSNETHRV